MPRDTVPLHAQVSHEARQAHLARLGFESYKDYCLSPHWRSVRRRYLASDLPQACSTCGAEQFHLHHKTYERLGAEELSDLEPLCTDCHKMIHVLLDRGEFVNFQDFASLDRANQYVEERRPFMARTREEAPPTLEERVYAEAKARSKARRRRKGQKKKPRPPKPATSHHWHGRLGLGPSE